MEPGLGHGQATVGQGPQIQTQALGRKAEMGRGEGFLRRLSEAVAPLVGVEFLQCSATGAVGAGQQRFEICQKIFTHALHGP